MVVFLILGSLLGAFAVVFAMENSAEVSINLLSWQLTAPMAIVIIASVTLGIIIMLLCMLPHAIRQVLDNYAIKREARRAESAVAYSSIPTTETVIK